MNCHSLEQVHYFALTISLSIAVGSTNAYAEGTTEGHSMNKVTREENLPVSVDSAWQVLADFGGFLNWAASGSIELEGEGPGMIRRLDMDGAPEITAERADVIDDDTRTLVYTLVEGNPIGMSSYKAKVQLHATGYNTCNITWQGEFTAVDGTDPDQVAAALKGAYVGMTKALVAHVAP